MFLGKGVLKKCSKFSGEHSCQSAISIKLLCCFINIAPQHGRSPVNLLYIFRTPFPRNTSKELLLDCDGNDLLNQRNRGVLKSDCYGNFGWNMENNWAEIFMNLVEFFCVDESTKGPILSNNLAIFSRKALQMNFQIILKIKLSNLWKFS